MAKRVKTFTEIVKVKQIIETDSVECANELLEGGWILLNTYKMIKGPLFYVLGIVQSE